MAIMEVNLPSGFTADIDSLPSLEVSQNVQKVETLNGDTTVLLYFNNITRLEYCPTVSSFQTHKVANQKPVYVSVYDYYDSCKSKKQLYAFRNYICIFIIARHARIFYKGRTSTVCNICDEEECLDVCKNEIEQQIAAESREDDKGKCSSFSISWLIVTILFATTVFFK